MVPHTKGGAVLFLLAAVPTLTGFGFYNLSLKFLPSLTVSLIASSEPAFTAVLAYFLLKERMDYFSALGCGLILLSVILVQTGNSRIPPGRFLDRIIG